ncbi:MAG TPA: flagellar motor protein [Bryobacteraceae bacterium]|nr:flagellar motor protein [Bryobacteraceae bacterium]
MADEQEQQEGKAKGGSFKPDFATIGGLLLAFGSIVAGLIMEKGNIHDVAQVTSALIVLGGTFGAVMVTTPLGTVVGAAKKFGSVFFGKQESPRAAIEEIIGYAAQARKDGIVSLEAQASAIADPFLNKALSLAVDGVESATIRDIMELEIQIMEEHIEAEARVFEAAGGYAPTIGIIGAVLGLIQVMKNLADIDEVGRGIAVAFVATIYGVAAANIIFLPAAGKLKARGKEAIQVRELMLEGVLAIANGVNQKLIRLKLEGYLGHKASAKKKGEAAAEAVAAEA